MQDVSKGTLWTLEGHNPRREPADGGEVKLKTVLGIVQAYWPDVNVEDFAPASLVRLESRLGG